MALFYEKCQQKTLTSSARQAQAGPSRGSPRCGGLWPGQPSPGKEAKALWTCPHAQPRTCPSCRRTCPGGTQSPVAVEPCRRGVVGTSLQSTPPRRPPCPVTRTGLLLCWPKEASRGGRGGSKHCQTAAPQGVPLRGTWRRGNGGVGARGVRTPGLRGVKARVSLLLGPPAVLVLQWSCCDLSLPDRRPFPGGRFEGKHHFHMAVASLSQIHQGVSDPLGPGGLGYAPLPSGG